MDAHLPSSTLASCFMFFRLCYESFDLSHRAPLTFSTFFTVFLPPVVLYYVTNVLAIVGPRTFVHRLALLPVTLFVTFRTIMSLNIASGFFPSEPGKLAHLNQTLVLAMFTVITRTLFRTFASQIPQRRDANTLTFKQILLEAADLTFNLRGIGWNFSASMKVPRYTRSLAPRSAFLRQTAQSLVAHLVVFDILHYICQLLSPGPVGSTASFSIFDMTIPNPLTRQLHVLVMSSLGGLCIYGAIQFGHDACSLIGVGLCHQSPSEWPPIFKFPWLSTSLADFWAVRWHQIFRQEFIAIGVKPLSLIAGRVGAVLGAFLLSGILHYVCLWGTGNGADARVILYFAIMGVGVLLEEMWRRLSSRRVGGWVGWVWTAVWVVGFGPLMIDPLCQSGVMGSVFIPHNVRPAVLLHRLIIKRR
ncbi:membrane bound O-acyl transferase family-domain-containing protein [Mycena pura]|uniref:Membrane bound O-acyl transferase family-domain-containing protein n=1 Tax=Mycena pura TaxID=153505 RepID=A0AAD6YR56_9AGAR|nr:membrane bound O-acyl transferase family-domain-containing protein [Mycena pura]